MGFSIRQCNGCEIDHPSQTQHPHLYADEAVYDEEDWMTIVKHIPVELVQRVYKKAESVLGCNGDYYAVCIPPLAVIGKDMSCCTKNTLTDQFQIDRTRWFEEAQHIRSMIPPYLQVVVDKAHDDVVKENRWKHYLQVHYLQHLLKALEIPDTSFEHIKQHVNKEEVIKEVLHNAVEGYDPIVVLKEFENNLKEDPKCAENVEAYLCREMSISYELQEAEIKIDFQPDELKLLLKEEGINRGAGL